MTPLEAQYAAVQKCIRNGEYEKARALLQVAMRRWPGRGDLNHAMAVVLSNLGQLPAAIYHAQISTKLSPNNESAHTTLGNAYSMSGKAEEAIAAYTRALEIDPNSAHARLGYSSTLKGDGRLEAAEEQLRLGLAANPNSMTLLTALAGVLLPMGRCEEAVRLSQEACQRFPDSPHAWTMLCNAVNYVPGLDPATALEAHLEYGRMLGRARPEVASQYPQSRDPERRLRIGMVSGDFRSHSVAYFVEPFFSHRDRERYELIAYMASLSGDAMTAHLRARADAWRDAAGWGDIPFAEAIRKDRIDVLVDLHGHTLGQRLPVFQLHPAPVQVTYCGYPHTTGMRAMGWRIVDSLTDPPGAERWAVERLLRIDPCFLCFRPPPPEQSPPCEREPGEGVVFGSFNALPKLNDPLVRAWTRLVNETPGSRLMLKAVGLGEAALRETIAARFVRAGLARERLELLGPTDSLRDHLALYGRMDIALDPFPYHGTTTTCEALYMGVPVVTRAGDQHASRVGVSLLSALGLEELITGDEEGCITACRELAASPARLAEYRRTLRLRMVGSALCDSPGWCRRFEGALREAWRNYCNGPR